jgi:hypothetical protein
LLAVAGNPTRNQFFRRLASLLRLRYNKQQWKRFLPKRIFLESAGSEPHPVFERLATTPWMGAFLLPSAALLLIQGR